MTNVIKKMTLFLMLLLFFIPKDVFAEENINIYLFYGDGCPHCEEELEALNEFKEEYPITILEYEVWENKTNENLLKEVLEEFGLNYVGVPFTVIGDEHFVGYSESYTKGKIEDVLDFYLDNEYNDVVGVILGDAEPTKTSSYKDEIKEISLPVFGKLDTNKVSLPLITIMMGIVDGFNPCAMWVLLFLISMLIGMKDRKKMWILGLTFIFTSAVIYFIFMAAWLNLIIFLGTALWIRLSIGLLGLIGGGLNLKSYIKTKDDGCEIVPEKKRTKTFDKIKKFTHGKSYLLAILGIITLALSVNIIELFCSLGLPVIYTKLLALNNLSTIGYYGYLLLYTLFFMLDDIIIFAIAMFTLKLTGVSTKYKKYSHLIGGIIMVLIGLALIFKPELIMFG